MSSISLGEETLIYMWKTFYNPSLQNICKIYTYWNECTCTHSSNVPNRDHICVELQGIRGNTPRDDFINHSSIDDFMSSISLGEVTSYRVRCNVCIVILARQLNIDNCLWWMMAEWHPYHQFISVTRCFIWLKQ
jgi:hypothetical protein